MTLESTLQADLRRFFSVIEKNVPRDDLEQMIPSITVGMAPGETFTFRGEALRLLRDLIRRIARPASEGGPSPDEADNLVTGACRRFLDAGEQEALDWLDSKLRESPRRWTVIRPTNTFQHRANEVVIGSCHLRRGLPELPFEMQGHAKKAFPAFTISVDVEARDQRAAELIAERRFAEALSVIQLLDRASTHALGLATLVVRPDATISFHEGPPSGANLDRIAMGNSGTLRPYFEALSHAVDRPANQRTDWEQRVLAASRWLSKALAVPWPSDSLISQMVALEALFVPPYWGSHKGRKIAEEVSERWLLPPMTKD